MVSRLCKFKDNRQNNIIGYNEYYYNKLCNVINVDKHQQCPLENHETSAKHMYKHKKNMETSYCVIKTTVMELIT